MHYFLVVAEPETIWMTFSFVFNGINFFRKKIKVMNYLIVYISCLKS